MKVIKRNGSEEDFSINKIVSAIEKAMGRVGAIDSDLAFSVASEVEDEVREREGVVAVDEVHEVVENTLMDMKLHDIAREYITYRELHKPDIYRKRISIKPYEYPHLLQYVDAIRHSYWLHTEFNYSPDIHDIRSTMNTAERTAAVRAMLAISQIESAVKTFWGKVHDHLPKPEIAKVGATFSESEVRHEDTYSNVLELLGLNEEFDRLFSNPVIAGRISYLNKANQYKDSDDPREYFRTIILFSMLIENVSLFSQFLIVKSFNRHRRMLKGISNGIEATSKEENIHAMFGFDLVNIIKQENPHWWTDEVQNEIMEMMVEAEQSESRVLDWIYEEGDISYIPKRIAKAYVRKRINDSLEAIGLPKLFVIAEEDAEQFMWFDDEVNVSKDNDFFNKRTTDYTKRTQSISAEDLI